VLVVGQVAVALVLLVGGGLLLRSLRRVEAVLPGFDPHGVTSLTVSLPGSRYPGAEQRLQFYADLIDRVRAEPGARAVGLASHLPLGAAPLIADFTPADRPGAAAAETPQAQLSVITPGYFEAAGIQLLKGRGLEQGDRAGAPAVALVDAVLAQRTWPGRDPIGQRIRVGAALGADTALREVVGVVAPVRSLGLEREPEPMIYLPHAQNPWPTMNLVIRIDQPADRVGARIAAQVQALDPEQPVYGVRSLGELLDRALALRRFQTVLLSGFALSALLLAVLGVYGILSFTVARQSRELGIRAALGATRETILASVLRQALIRVGWGCLLGGVAALAVGRLLQSVLYQVSPADPLSFGGAGLVLVGAGLAAAYLPARRAMGVEPVEVLRGE
jgi:predicted permease